MRLSNSEDAHRLLVEEAEHSWTLGLMAFSILEDRRFDWMKHFAENNGRRPNADEITYWYEQQSERVLQDVLADAESALTLLVEDALEEVRRGIEQDVIVQEIRQGRRFLPQFGISVAGGVVSALIFAAILVVLAFLVFVDPSPIKFMRDVGTAPTEESSNGEADRQ